MAQENETNEQAREKKFLGGLLEGLSVPQVAAGALAAVTSMLLSAKIGIAGSVIGVAVGSVVSTLSSQIYKQFLQASADKLRELSPLDDVAGAGAAGASTTVSAGEAAGVTRVMDPNATRMMAHAGAAETQLMDPAATRVMPGAAASSQVDGGAHAAGAVAGETVAMPPAVAAGTSAAAVPSVTETPTRSVQDLRASGETGVLRGRAEHLHRQRVQRGVIAVSVVSALVAVLITAGIIDLVTAGEGVGAKTEPLFTSTSTEQSADSQSSNSKQSQSAQQGAQSQQGTNDSAASTVEPVHQGDSASSSDASASGSSSNGSSTGTSSSSTGSGNDSSTSSSTGTSTGSGAASSGSQAGSSMSGSTGSSTSGGDASTSGSASASGNSSSQSGSSSGGSTASNGTSATSAS